MQVPLLLIGVFVVCSTAEPARFDDYKVYRVICETQDQVEVLLDLEHQMAVPEDIGFSYWQYNPLVGGITDIMVSPEKHDYIIGILKKANFKYEMIIENVQDLIDAETGTKRPR